MLRFLIKKLILILMIMKKKWLFQIEPFLKVHIYFTLIFLFIYPHVKLFGYTATSIPPMLKMDYGSQSLGMGGASVALTDNLYYMDSNPAAGMLLKVYRFSILHQEWIYDTNYESFRFSIGCNNSYFGVGFNYLYTPFKYYDIYGVESNNTYNISQYLGLINFGYKFNELNMILGANVKYYYYAIPNSLYSNQSYSLILGDIGIILPTNFFKRYKGYLPSLTFGLSIRNIGFSKSLYHIPINILSGASYRYSNNLLISIELNIPIYEPITFSMGAEYTIKNRYFIDVGFTIKENPMFSMGLGYRKKDFRIRISYSPTIKFYNMMNISFSYSYGESRAEDIKEEVNKLLLKALEYFSKGKYRESLEIVAKAMDLEPENYRAKKLYKIIERQLEIEKKLEDIQKKVNEE